MCIAMLFSFTACSGSTEINEKNITDTVETVETALQEFDTKTLKKYVSSETLNYIIKFADKHDQFKELGIAIFENMTMQVKEIDLENSTVTVSIMNKDLYIAATNFASELKNKYSTLQLINLLDNEAFLDISLEDLTEQIDDAYMKSESIDVKLNVSQGNHNLVLSFDEDAEDAVSGGALTAIQSIWSNS
jgi:hypothetical protein